MAAPSYTNSVYSAPTSPPYSPSVTDGERILELRPSQSTIPVNLPDVYVFQSERIKIDLGPRVWPTSTPCYGFGGLVEGVVTVASLDHVKRLKVTLEGIVKASFMERGVLAGHVESTLFHLPVVLYASGSSPGTNYSFSLRFPCTGDKDGNPLPPSLVNFLPGVSAEVRYRVRIDLSRSGFRRHESLVVPLLYLPRSYTPPMASPSLFSNRSGFAPEYDSLKELCLAPKPIVKTSSKSKLPPYEDVEAKILLPCPLVVASGDRIPFALTIKSRSPALAALYTDVTLQLVKHLRIKAYERSVSKETVISSGEVYDVEHMGDGTQILRGELGNGAPGRESSWSAAGLVEVKHTLKLSIKPPSCTTALSLNVPMFEGTLLVQIVTHQHSPHTDASVPALGLIGIDAV